MKVLVFAPHNDDEVLGAGGTIAKYAGQGHDVTVCEVTTCPYTELAERIKDEARAAHNILGVRETIFLDLPVVALRDIPTAQLNKSFDDIVRKIKPEIAFIPHIGDMHVDHQDTAAAAMVALRPFSCPQLKAVYAYEALSESEWNTPNAVNAFIPTVWSDITDYMDTKLKAMACYKTQIKEFPHPRSLKGMEALAILRGSTVGEQYAESFSLIRGRI